MVTVEESPPADVKIVSASDEGLTDIPVLREAFEEASNRNSTSVGLTAEEQQRVDQAIKGIPNKGGRYYVKYNGTVLSFVIAYDD